MTGGFHLRRASNAENVFMFINWLVSHSASNNTFNTASRNGIADFLMKLADHHTIVLTLRDEDLITLFRDSDIVVHHDNKHVSGYWAKISNIISFNPYLWTCRPKFCFQFAFLIFCTMFIISYYIFWLDCYCSLWLYFSPRNWFDASHLVNDLPSPMTRHLNGCTRVLFLFIHFWHKLIVIDRLCVIYVRKDSDCNI